MILSQSVWPLMPLWSKRLRCMWTSKPAATLPGVKRWPIGAAQWSEMFFTAIIT